MMRLHTTHAAVMRLEALRGPSPADRITWLAEAAEALAVPLQTLAARPTPESAERVATQLEGMHRQALALIPLLARQPF